ncbi:MAG: insulinase family protein, partial [Holosporales bacterium]|nr:insulinase family protein [Holosporales bacterium]
MHIETSRLGNGLIVATDRIDNFVTASVGIFVKIGSVNESSSQTGLSHFLEHMAFNGTKKRTALEISQAIESVGGHINAYTSKEITAYHVKILHANLDLAIDIITDIISDPVFDKAEFNKEKSVIIQEIRQLNDTPDDLVFDMFQAKCFDGEKLGTQILGSEEEVNSYTPDDLKNYLKTKYSADKMILCASGGIKHDDVVHLTEKFSSKMTKFDVDQPNGQKYKGGFTFKKKDLEQAHLVLGFEGCSNTDPSKYDLLVLSTILGSGMSSRLFQEIREKRGLVYSIFSFISNYKDTGTFGVYAGCENDKAQEVIGIIKNEFDRVCETLREDEIRKAKTQINASILMGLESSSTRMERVAHQLLQQNKFLTPQEITEKVNAVDAK